MLQIEQYMLIYISALTFLNLRFKKVDRINLFVIHPMHFRDSSVQYTWGGRKVLRVWLYFSENQPKPKMENAPQCASFQGTKKKKYDRNSFTRCREIDFFFHLTKTIDRK